jgi:hypothetical protein
MCRTLYNLWSKVHVFKRPSLETFLSRRGNGYQAAVQPPEPDAKRQRVPEGRWTKLSGALSGHKFERIACPGGFTTDG